MVNEPGPWTEFWNILLAVIVFVMPFWLTGQHSVPTRGVVTG